MSVLRERIKTLRKQAADLEATAVEEGQREGSLNALQQERHTIEQHLARALSHPPNERELLSNPFGPEGADVQAAKTWGQRAAELERRIEAIDNELKRVLLVPVP